MKQVFYIAIILFFASCEKTVTIDIPQRAPKLVINARMQEGELINAIIGKSRNVLQPNSSGSNFESYIVKDALAVVLVNNQPVDTLYYQPAFYRYQSKNNVFIEQGKTYTLRVSAPGFETVEATTIVPSSSEIKDIVRNKEARTSSDGQKQDEILVRLEDPAAEANFYLIRIRRADYGGGGYFVYCVSTTDKDVEPIGENADPFTTDNCYDGSSLLVKDPNFNGQEKTLRFFVDSYELQEYTDPGGIVHRPSIEVLRITEDYFKYLKSYNVYFNSSDNPFAEPSNVFSNVAKGYGIFSAYTIEIRPL